MDKIVTGQAFMPTTKMNCLAVFVGHEDTASVKKAGGDSDMSDSSEKKPTAKNEVVHPDCPYCGQVGGVSQYDSICGEHDVTQALGWVVDGQFASAEKKP